MGISQDPELRIQNGNLRSKYEFEIKKSNDSMIERELYGSKTFFFEEYSSVVFWFFGYDSSNQNVCTGRPPLIARNQNRFFFPIFLSSCGVAAIYLSSCLV